MFYGCVGVIGGGVWDIFRGRCCLVVVKQEEGTGGLEGLAFLDKAGMIFILLLRCSPLKEKPLSTRLLIVLCNDIGH